MGREDRPVDPPFVIFLLNLCNKFVMREILLSLTRRLLGFHHVLLGHLFGVFQEVLLFQKEEAEPFLANSTLILQLLHDLLSPILKLNLLVHGIPLILVVLFLVWLLLHPNLKQEILLVPLLLL